MAHEIPKNDPVIPGAAQTDPITLEEGQAHVPLGDFD